MQKLLNNLSDGGSPRGSPRAAKRLGRHQPQQPSQGGSSVSSEPAEESLKQQQEDLTLEDWNQQQKHTAASTLEQEQERLWAELGRARWCPVLREAPAPGLPWTAAGGGSASSAAPLAAPCACRPASDVWLASASCGIVDGAPRSSALLARLGWSRPLSGALLGAQLVALGAMHAAPVCDDTARVLAEQVRRLFLLRGGLWLPCTSVSTSVCGLLQCRQQPTRSHNRSPCHHPPHPTPDPAPLPRLDDSGA